MSRVAHLMFFANVISIVGHMLINENQLDNWVRGNAQIAQGVIVELVWRLVAASSPNPKERRFPLGDSVGQPGPDGFLDVDLGYKSLVPEGKSFWEIGTGHKSGAKATADYKELTKITPYSVRIESAFVFVTPLSGRREWEFAWKDKQQLAWLKKRRDLKEWRSVHVIDGTVLVEWMQQFPAVAVWLAGKMGYPIHQIQSIECRWDELKTIGSPPPLTPQVFLVQRASAGEKIKDVLSGVMLQLKLDTYFPDQAVNFIAAYVESVDEELKIDIAGRCLVVSGGEGWNSVVALRDRHVLIADFNLDGDDSTTTRLLEKANRAGHAVIYAGMPGGLPHPTRVSIPNAKAYQIEDALKQAGYNEERARTLAHRSGGDLNLLLRCIQSLSTIPEWAQGTPAAELVVANLLGGWDDGSESDKEIVEKQLGKRYGEWIERMRDLVVRPNTPLTQRNGIWRVALRYEAWYALGPRVFDEHLDRFKEVASLVLREIDPKLDLPPEDRHAASIYGKFPRFSRPLRVGVANSLALLGSHSGALVSASIGKARGSANYVIREIFSNASWQLWASIDDLLPLIAEAAPEEFLGAVDAALANDSDVVSALFAQERSGIGGHNYLSGLLWALESLAWGADYLVRVVVILGEMAARDPGGNWANRPINSLSRILLPWLPQTCAPLSRRLSAIHALIREVPGVAWDLLLSLLSRSNSVAFPSHRPTWRELIPSDWPVTVTTVEFWGQIDSYSKIALDWAARDSSKLITLASRLDDLPDGVRESLLDHLGPEQTGALSGEERYRLWDELVDVVSRHRRFADADWAMSPVLVSKVEAVARVFVPEAASYRYRRLFTDSEFDLLDGTGNADEQLERLQKQRQDAVAEVYRDSDIEGVLGFAAKVEASGQVGFAFGIMAPDEVDNSLIPGLLEPATESAAKFIGGFIWRRYQSGGWEWVDTFDMRKWPASQTAQFLAYLPFTSSTWRKAKEVLGENESLYWMKANVNPHSAKDDLHQAIDNLMKVDRLSAAVWCLEWMARLRGQVDARQALFVLDRLRFSPDAIRAVRSYAIITIIKTLQADAGLDVAELAKIEWAFLPLLHGHSGGSPKTLGRQTSIDPDFFCELIRLIFRSRNGEPDRDVSEEVRDSAANAYRLLFDWKLPPGTQDDGTFDGATLGSWLEDVKRSSKESGHFEAAMDMAGHVLAHTPPDPDGLWLHHSVAIALNAKDADALREGFVSELLKSRGVFIVDPTGDKDREIANGYRTKADALEAHGYQRLASSVRGLAAFYDGEAERRASDESSSD